MEKDFNAWNVIKQNIEKSSINVYGNQREIWRCSFGINVGTELCGKNELFERPVLILKVFNKDTLKVVPLTSQVKIGKYYTPVTLGEITSYATLSQAKTISSKRLSRKIGRISIEEYLKIKTAYIDML
jgi:mRNA-degrading endonuclease toxin of MazEF toxin-antitoxin module